MSPARRGRIGLCKCQRLKQLPGFRPGKVAGLEKSPLSPPTLIHERGSPFYRSQESQRGVAGHCPVSGWGEESAQGCPPQSHSGLSSLQWGCGHQPVDLSSRTIDTESLAGRASLGQGSESAHETPTGHVAAPPTCATALSLLFRTPDFSRPECPRLVFPRPCVPMAGFPHTPERGCSPHQAGAEDLPAYFGACLRAHGVSGVQSACLKCCGESAAAKCGERDLRAGCGRGGRSAPP